MLIKKKIVNLVSIRKLEEKKKKEGGKKVQQTFEKTRGCFTFVSLIHIYISNIYIHIYI